jgi:hypothetical protein
MTRWRWFRSANLLRAAAALALLGPGCGDSAPRPETARRVIEVGQLPPEVIGAAKKQLPDIAFDEAWTNVGATGAIASYEVRGRAPNGRIREVKVSPEGQILEME